MLVVDDHLVVAETFRMAIDVEDDLECVGLAGTVEEAVALVAELSPDVVLMDVQLPVRTASKGPVGSRPSGRRSGC